MAAPSLTLLSFALLLHTALSLEHNFYRNSCPRAEEIARSVLEEHFKKDPSVAAGLLRLFFHDCFIRVSALSLSLSLSPTPTHIIVIITIHGERTVQLRT